MGSMLRTTLELKTADGVAIPFQNGIPVPSFEPQERETLSLHGEWRKRRFAADHGFSMRQRDAAWLLELERREGSWLRGGIDGEGSGDGDGDGDGGGRWELHTIPSTENALGGEERAGAAETYEDGVWYCRSFRLGSERDEAVYVLKSLGMSYIADVWVNGAWIGYHEGGFTPFAFDVTERLRAGMNELRIRIDNPPWGSRSDSIPAVAGTDFFNYTGIVQDLFIEVLPAVHVVRADIVPLDTSGRLQATVVLANRSRESHCVVLDGELFEADRDGPDYLASPHASSIVGRRAAVVGSLQGEVCMGAGETRVVRREVKVAEPKLWDVRQPNLYVGEFALSLPGHDGAPKAERLDRFHTQFGIRTVRTRGTNILLNGEPVFLAGIARHEEWPDTGRTASWERIRGDLQQIAGMNANFVRTGHYPNHVYSYLLLDRLGLLAASEIPLWQFETEHYEAQEEKGLAVQMWREMVYSQYNRPSVVLWSTQNESKDVELRLALNRRLVRDLRERYNDGRLTTQSAAADQPGPLDPSMEPLDVAGWTMYFGIFHGGTYYEGTRDFLKAAHAAYPDKPILNTEFGHWTGEAEEEADRQLATYEETLRALMEQATITADGEVRPEGYVAGIDFWIMYNWYVNHNRWIDTFGIWRMDRRKEKAIAARIRADYGRITGADAGGRST